MQAWTPVDLPRRSAPLKCADVNKSTEQYAMANLCLVLVQYVSYERPALSKAYLFPESARHLGLSTYRWRQCLCLYGLHAAQS